MPAKPHIAFVIHALQAGGAERMLTTLANAFAARGYRVSIVVFDSAERPAFFPLDDRVQVHYLDVLPKSRNLLLRIWAILKRFWVLRRKLTVIASGKVVSFIDVTNVTTLIAMMGAGASVYVAERSNPFHHKIPKIVTFLRRKVYPWAEKVIVQTKDAGTYFEALPKHKIAVIPNIVNQPSYEPARRNGQICRLITTGRLVTSKNHQLLIRAFANLVRENPTLSLTVCGDGPEREALEKLIAELSLKGKVLITGLVENVSEYLEKADLFVFPTAYEGFPNALGEAIAHGLPVIASDIPGNRELVINQETGLLVGVGDQRALERALDDFINNPEKAFAMASAGLGHIQHFSEEKVIKKWEETIGNE